MRRSRLATVLSLVLGGVLLLVTSVIVQAEHGATCNGKAPTIFATNGNGNTVGTEQADVIQGTDGKDRIDGRGGDDTICGNSGKDEIHGGDGNDSIYGNLESDVIFGDGGDDRINVVDGVVVEVRISRSEPASPG